MVEATRTGKNAGPFTIMIDDVSLLEVAAHGSVDNVLDFLYYCVTLTSEMVKDPLMKLSALLLTVTLFSSFSLILCPGRIAPW